MTMALLSAKLAFHTIVAVIDVYTIYYDFFFIDSGYRGLGGKFRFLTTWCIYLQSTYFVLCVFIDITDNDKKPSKDKMLQRSALCKFRDIFHSSLAFPIGFFGALLFWSLYTFNNELVRSKKLEGLVPFWINHVTHTTILPFIVMDKLFTFHVYPRRLWGLLITCTFGGSYVVWLFLIAYIDNVWVYPILQKLGMQERAVFIFVCVVAFILCYFVGEILTKVIWGRQKRPISNKKD